MGATIVSEPRPMARMSKLLSKPPPLLAWTVAWNDGTYPHHSAMLSGWQPVRWRLQGQTERVRRARQKLRQSPRRARTWRKHGSRGRRMHGIHRCFCAQPTCAASSLRQFPYFRELVRLEAPTASLPGPRAPNLFPSVESPRSFDPMKSYQRTERHLAPPPSFSGASHWPKKWICWGNESEGKNKHWICISFACGVNIVKTVFTYWFTVVSKRDVKFMFAILLAVRKDVVNPNLLIE